jgi:hypothetical protein
LLCPGGLAILEFYIVSFTGKLIPCKSGRVGDFKKQKQKQEARSKNQESDESKKYIKHYRSLGSVWEDEK